MKNIKFILVLLLIWTIINACNKDDEMWATQKLKGTWTEIAKNPEVTSFDSLNFVDNTTVTVKTKNMPFRKAYKFRIESDHLVLLYQNSALNWVEGVRYPFEFKEDKLIILGLSHTTQRNKITVFRKVN